MEDEHTRSSATTNNTKPTASKSEVISSAKVIIDAAKSAFANDNENIDKAKVADAAADILGATNHYGKLEDKSYGKLINKAEGYLHGYNSSHSPSAATNAATAHNADGKKEHGGGGGGYGEYMKMAQGLMGGKGDHDGVHGHASHGGGDGEHGKSSHGHVNKDDIHHGGSGGGGGGGGGHGGHEHSSGGGGYGEYVKMAQGFVGKH